MIGGNALLDLDLLELAVQSCFMAKNCLFNGAISSLYPFSQKKIVNKNQGQVQRCDLPFIHKRRIFNYIGKDGLNCQV